MNQFTTLLKKIDSQIKIYSMKLNSLAFATWFGVNVGIGDDFSSEDSLVDKILEVLKVATTFAPLVAIAIIIYGGYTYILSAGEEGQIEKAQSTITAGVVGLVIVVIANLIIRFVISQVIMGEL
jgi:hypothetical protein